MRKKKQILFECQCVYSTKPTKELIEDTIGVVLSRRDPVSSVRSHAKVVCRAKAVTFISESGVLVRPRGSPSPSALMTELVLEKWRSFHMLTNGRSQIDIKIRCVRSKHFDLGS